MEDIKNSRERFDSRISNAMLKPGHVRTLHIAKPSKFLLGEISSLSRLSDCSTDSF
jgi:hypothetical protein